MGIGSVRARLTSITAVLPPPAPRAAVGGASVWACTPAIGIASVAAEPAAPARSERRLSGRIGRSVMMACSLNSVGSRSETESENPRLAQHRLWQREIGAIRIHHGTDGALGKHAQADAAAHAG